MRIGAGYRRVVKSAMKAFKILAIALGAVAFLVLVGAAVAFTSGFQTWAVRKATAGQPGLTIEIGRVAAGLSAADLTDLRVVKDGVVITAKSVSAKYSAWDYLTKKRVNVELVSVPDLLVDLRNATPPKPAATTTAAPAASAAAGNAGGAPAKKTNSAGAAPAPFDGLLRQAQLPLEVRVVSLAVKGRALLPHEQAVAFDLQVAGIETGQRGKVEWKVDFTDAQKAAPLQALRAAGSLALHIASDRRIDLIEIAATATAEGPQLPRDQIKLEAKAEQAAAGGNESYTVSVGLVRAGAVEPLLSSRTEFQTAARQFAGTWEIGVRSEQLTAILSGFGLPDLAVKGAGKFTLKPDTAAVTASGDLKVDVAHLEKISPDLAAIGGVQLQTSFDGAFADNVVRLESFQLEATAADGKKLAQVNTVQRIGFSLADKRVSLADPKAELARISVQALPLAYAQPFAKPLVIESGDLSLVLAVEAEADGSHVRVRTIEPVTLRTVTLRSGNQKVADRVTISVRPRVDYSAARVIAELADLKISMPDGDAVAGVVNADITNLATTPIIAFSAQLQAKIVAALKPYLPGELNLGPLTMKAALEGQLEGQTLRLSKAVKTVTRDNNVLLASVELQQPVAVDLKKPAFSVPNPAATAARLRLGEVPLAWAEAFVPKSKFAGVVSGASLEVSFRGADDITVKTAEPIILRGAGVTMDGKALTQSLDLSAEFTATKKGDIIAYDLRRAEVKQGNLSLASVTVAGEMKPGAKLNVSAKGNLAVDLAALLGQPALAPYATLSRGKLTTTFEATIGDVIRAKAAVATQNLTARQNSAALGDLDLSLNVEMKTDGSGTVTLPLTLVTGGRRSDLKLDGTFAHTARANSFNGKISSDQLVADDFQALAALAPASPLEAKPAATPPRAPAKNPATRPSVAPVVTRDAAPVWKGVNGKVELDVKKILYGRDYAISGVRGTATITDARLALDGLEGKFKENPFKITAGVTFAEQRAQPYALTGDVNVTNLDLGEILRAANPNEKPAIETKVTVLAKLNGNGATLPDLAQNAYGQFDVSGSAGVLWGLAGKPKVAEAVGAISSLLGAYGKAKGSDNTVAVSELTGEINEMRFDKFTARIDRGTDLNLKVTAFEFISPTKRVTGTGSITYRKGVTLMEQPLKLEAVLAGKDSFARLLNQAQLLGGAQDDKGYSTMRRAFSVGGTAAKPDSSQLWLVIGEAAARAAVGTFLR